jgi:hypothetical protein
MLFGQTITCDLATAAGVVRTRVELICDGPADGAAAVHARLAARAKELFPPGAQVWASGVTRLDGEKMNFSVLHISDVSGSLLIEGCGGTATFTPCGGE